MPGKTFVAAYGFAWSRRMSGAGKTCRDTRNSPMSMVPVGFLSSGSSSTQCRTWKTRLSSPGNRGSLSAGGGNRRHEADVRRHRRLSATMLYHRHGLWRMKVIGFEYTDTVEFSLKPLL